MDMALMETFILQVMGRALDGLKPVPISGWQAVEALWPLNERFRPQVHQIRALPYLAAYEDEADAAIAALALNRPGADWSGLSGEAWRVLLERQQQILTVAVANEVAGNTKFMSIPSGLPKAAWTGFAMLFWLHRMKLPFPVEDRSGYELPAGTPPTSLRRH
jgi:hypothetical protein